GVGDIGVPALADEISKPALAAIWRGLVGHAGEPAAVPHQEWQPASAVLRQEVLHVHLLDLILAVRVHLRGYAAGCEPVLLDRLAAKPDAPPADVERAHVA